MFLIFLQHFIIVLGILVTNLGRLLHFGDFTLNLLQILALQLKIHNLNVANRIDGALLVRQGRVVKAAQHVDERVAETHVSQEAVADAGALAGTLGQTRNVHNIQVGKHQLVCLDKGVDIGKTLVRHGAHADVGLVGAIRKVRHLRLRVGDAVEHRGLARVRESDYAAF